MRILRKMVFAEFFGIFIAALITLSAMFLLVDFFDRVQRFVGEGGAPVKLLIFYLLYKLPQLLYDITPLNLPLAALITLGIFNRRSELVAMRAAGIPVRSVLRPVFLFALLIAVGLFTVGEKVLPVTNLKQMLIENEIRRFKQGTKLAESGERHKKGPTRFVSGWYRGAKGIYFIRGYKIESRRIRNFVILEINDDFKVKRRTDAERAYWKNNRWEGYKVTVRDFSAQGDVLVKTHKKMIIDIPENAKELEVMEKDPKMLGFFELALFINRLEADGSDMRPFRVDLWSKLTYPFSGLILLVLAIPLGLKTGRGVGVAGGIVWSLVICLTYFEFNAWVLSMGRGMAIQDPLVAVFTAPALFGIIALPMYFRSN